MTRKRTPTADTALELLNAEQGKEPKPDKIQTRKETRQLACKLTEPEVTQYGRDLAAKHAENNGITADLTKMKTEFKGKLETVAASIGLLSGRIQSGVEYRDVACEETRNWTLGLVTVIRTDTGEEITRRPMREDEKQMEIPGVVPEAEEPETDEDGNLIGDVNE